MSVPSLRTWRVSTACRAFALALAAGMVVRDGTIGESGPLLAALGLIAGVTSMLEWGATTRSTSWIPIGEAALVAILLSSASPQPGLLPYLVVPGVVSGVRHGWVTVANSTLVGAAAVVGTLGLNPSAGLTDRVGTSAPWLLIGLGVGLLASWQSRSTRGLAARQAPHAVAHRLMERLYQLASSGSLGLNTVSLAADLDAAMRAATGCAHSTTFVAAPDESLRPLNGGDDAGRLMQEIGLASAERTPGAAVISLRGAQRILGYCVLVGVPRWTPELAERAAEVADEFSVRIDTAMLFDDVRALATSEERNRIARDMHDGVAQEIVGLGYIVDEIESISDQHQTRELAAALRAEITRLVSEIRFSIFDLRHEVTDGRLAASLADYTREVSHATGLRVHLSLAESGPPLPPRTATEVLRVAQEAIGNVRKHAHARNLWVSLVSDGTSLRLSVEDDGVGRAAPRDHHWGLQTMRERATNVGAYLDVAPRDGGGTVVSLQSTETIPSEGEIPHGHDRAAG